ncbi:MAG: TerB family tellurite resistance protein [Myxococcales bacterium]|nr:TerB family tellurite resistance protein [Myxococcales bacterium]
MVEPAVELAVELAKYDAPKLEAMIETLFLAAHADGEFSDAERAHFAKSVESLTDNRLAGEPFAALLARIEAGVAASGREARLAAVRERLPAGKPREIALSLAIRLMASDGILRTTERELIMEAADALEVDRDVAADMVRDAASA